MLEDASRQHFTGKVLSDEYWVDEFKIQLQASHSQASVQGSSISDHEGELDRVVYALDSLKANIRRRRNFLRPTSKLLPEILSQIFEHHAEMEPPLSRDSSEAKRAPKASRLGWLVDTHVCHRWRQIAISHAALWGRIPFVLGQNWVQVSLSRAQSSGLTMQYTIPAKLPAVLHIPTNTFSDHIHQTVELRLSSRNIQESRKIIRALVNPAPLLETLALDLTHPAELWQPPMALPADLFARHAPLLRNVHLHYVYLPWETSLLRNLRELIISGDGSGLGTRTSRNLVPSGDRLLDVLRACPNLQTLVLRHCLPFTHNIHADTPPVPLHSLERLSLRDRIAGVECVLRHCTLSPLCRQVNVCIKMSADDVPRITSILNPLSSATHAHSLNTMSISVGNPMKIRAWRTLPTVNVWGRFTDPHSAPDIDITLFLCDSDGRPNTIVTTEDGAEMLRVGDLLPLGEIQVVTVHSSSSIGQCSIPFLARTKMKHLIVYPSPWDTSFATAEQAPSTGVPGALLHPELKSIWVHEFDFEPRPGSRRPLFAEQLQLYLAQRSTAGTKVETVVLDGCYGTSPELLEGLKCVVLKVGLRWGYSKRDDPELC